MRTAALLKAGTALGQGSFVGTCCDSRSSAALEARVSGARSTGASVGGGRFALPNRDSFGDMLIFATMARRWKAALMGLQQSVYQAYKVERQPDLERSRCRNWTNAFAV